MSGAAAAESTPDIHNAASQIQMAKDGYGEQEVLPTRAELGVWYHYDISFFHPTLLLTVVFPLLLLHLVPSHSPTTSTTCAHPQYHMYQTLVRRSVSVGAGGLKLSPLNFSPISWAVGVVISAPVMALVGFHLHHGRAQHLISAVAFAVGVLVCLPTGFFKSPWPFLPYTAVVVAASTVAAAGYACHLGLLVRVSPAQPSVASSSRPGRPSPGGSRPAAPPRGSSAPLSSQPSPTRCSGGPTCQRVCGSFPYSPVSYDSPACTTLWGSGCRGPRRSRGRRRGSMRRSRLATPTPPSASPELSSPPSLLRASSPAACYTWSPCSATKRWSSCRSGWPTSPPPLLSLSLSLSLRHLLSLLIRSDALRVQLISLLTTAATAGSGFFYCRLGWHAGHVLAPAAAQSTEAGALHACGLVLVMNSSPPAREKAFAGWLAWGRTAGTWAGFSVPEAAAADEPAEGRSFAAAFCGAMAGVLVMVVGKVRHLGGAAAAGHVREVRSERGSPARGLDSSEVYVKDEVLEKGRVQL